VAGLRAELSAGAGVRAVGLIALPALSSGRCLVVCVLQLIPDRHLKTNSCKMLKPTCIKHIRLARILRQQDVERTWTQQLSDGQLQQLLQWQPRLTEGVVAAAAATASPAAPTGQFQMAPGNPESREEINNHIYVHNRNIAKQVALPNSSRALHCWWLSSYSCPVSVLRLCLQSTIRPSCRCGRQRRCSRQAADVRTLCCQVAAESTQRRLLARTERPHAAASAAARLSPARHSRPSLSLTPR